MPSTLWIKSLPLAVPWEEKSRKEVALLPMLKYSMHIFFLIGQAVHRVYPNIKTLSNLCQSVLSSPLSDLGFHFFFLKERTHEIPTVLGLLERHHRAKDFDLCVYRNCTLVTRFNEHI